MLRSSLILLLLTPLSGRGDNSFTNPTIANVPTLVTLLADPNLRQGASNALVGIGGPSVSRLITSLESTDIEVAIWTAFTLGKMGPEASAAASALSERLSSADKDLRAVAARSLGQIRSTVPSVITTLAVALSDEDSRVREHAVTALGEIGQPAQAAVPSLIAALADETVRSRAIKALVQIGPLAVPALRSALDDNTIRMEAAEALRAIDPQAARDAGVDATSARDLPALAISVAKTQKDATARIEHLNRLGDLGADAALVLIAVFDDPSIEVSRASVSAFRKIGSDALPKLREALRHESPSIRSATANALAAVGLDAKPAIADLAKLLSDSDRSVRNAAATACDQLGPIVDAAVPALIVTMNDNREQEATRQLAIKALVQSGPTSRDSVIKALRDVNHQGNFGVRSLAQEMLKQIERQ